jgi:L-ascorbate metabolism protein UlaG (beta-lactamase superfamily)
MKLKWYGHASFLVTADDGTTIITDPYTPETSGYLPIPDAPDVVIISSDNDSFHCRADLIPGNPIVINALEVAQNGGLRTEKGIDFHAIQAMEAVDHREHDPDQNGMYRFTVDGISIGHMGDIGNPLTPSQIEFFKDVDIFLALTGGHPVLELDELKEAIDAAKPRYVVPMHFRTLRYKPRNQYWIESFLQYFPNEQIDFASNYEITLSRADIPTETRVLVLTHSQ